MRRITNLKTIAERHYNALTTTNRLDSIPTPLTAEQRASMIAEILRIDKGAPAEQLRPEYYQEKHDAFIAGVYLGALRREQRAKADEAERRARLDARTVEIWPGAREDRDVVARAVAKWAGADKKQGN